MSDTTEQKSTSNNERRVAIITGANTGIGKETAKALFRQNYHVIMACRTQERANEAIEEIVQAIPDKPRENLEFLKLELDTLQSVREFAQNFLAKNTPLHVLICNAGIMATPFGKTKDGFEQQFGVNHLAHFLLTNLLLDKLKESAPSRVVVVSSKVHDQATDKTLPLTLEKLNDPKSYERLGAYSNSKLANVLFANELTRRLRKDGVTNVTVNSLHPGVVATELVRNMPAILRALWYPFSFLIKTPADGAKTSVYVATSPDVEGVSGEYFDDSKKSKASKYGLDEKLASDLWEFSEKLVSEAQTSNSNDTQTTN